MTQADIDRDVAAHLLRDAIAHLERRLVTAPHAGSTILILFDKLQSLEGA